jgi:drug/metabolite transporter (DMT)-like permease
MEILIIVSIIVGIILSAITVFGDYLIKHASLQTSFTGWKFLIAGAIIYGLTAFGWFFVMRKIKLSTLGVLYGISCIILLVFVSIFYFKEKITPLEIVGIVLAITSIIIMARFA